GGAGHPLEDREGGHRAAGLQSRHGRLGGAHPLRQLSLGQTRIPSGLGDLLPDSLSVHSREYSGDAMCYLPGGISSTRPTCSAYAQRSMGGGSTPSVVRTVQIWLRCSVPWCSACASRMPIVVWVSDPSSWRRTLAAS